MYCDVVNVQPRLNFPDEIILNMCAVVHMEIIGSGCVTVCVTVLVSNFILYYYFC